MHLLLSGDAYFRRSIYLQGKRSPSDYHPLSHRQSPETDRPKQKLQVVTSRFRQKQIERSKKSLNTSRDSIKSLIGQVKTQNTTRVDQLERHVQQLIQQIKIKNQKINDLMRTVEERSKAPPISFAVNSVTNHPFNQVEASLKNRLVCLNQENIRLKSQLSKKQDEIESLRRIITTKQTQTIQKAFTKIDDWQPQRKKYEQYVIQLQKHHTEETDHYIQIVTKQEAKILQMEIAASTNPHLSQGQSNPYPNNQMLSLSAEQVRHSQEIDALMSRLGVAESQLEFLKQKYTHLLDMQMGKNEVSKNYFKEISPNRCSPLEFADKKTPDKNKKSNKWIAQA